jgi:hypothetical protein
VTHRRPPIGLSRAQWHVLVIASCFLIALVAAVASIDRVGLLPPSLTPRQIEIFGAATRVAVDKERPVISDSDATSYDYDTLSKRTVLLANLMASKPAIAYIARRARLDPHAISADAQDTSQVQHVLVEPDSERRARRIANQYKPYQLLLRPSPTLPTMDVFTQAPSVLEATRLADSVVPGMLDYLAALARRAGREPAKQLQLDQLGPSRGAVINGGAKVEIFGLTFVFAFVMACLLALAGSRVLRHLRAPAGARGVTGPPAADGELLANSPVLARTRRAARKAGDWPHTTRALPWMVAMMIAVVWLVPFNDIVLNVSLPIDLKFDRLVLPLIIGAWALALAAGGREAPRLRLTWIHVAIGAVVVAAFLSLVLEARTLNQTLEFDLAIKKLVLLGSYVSLFVIVASVVRRGEVRPFFSYTLGLALICALGTIIEFRFNYNVFYQLSDKILPGIFQVGAVDSSGVDELGRRMVRGPAQHSLEVVAMMAMALPIALTRLLQTDGLRKRMLYGLAAAILLAATVSTLRKTAFLAPISVCLTLAYYRRRELIKLAPLGVLLVLVIQLMTPGSLSQVAGQLNGNKLGVNTVSDRTADYDAIRPDVWSHLAFGRGYGSYEPTTYRVTDMELLRQLIEVGVVGVLAFVMMIVAVVGVARGPIRARRPDEAPIALSVASSAVCLLVVSTLFDVMSFPHVPYVFLWMAALLAVITEPRPVSAPEPSLEDELLELPPARAREPAWT